MVALAASEFADQIEWVRDYDQSLPDIEADRDQIIQSILNVVRNACEALSNTAAPKVCATNKDHPAIHHWQNTPPPGDVHKHYRQRTGY